MNAPAIELTGVTKRFGEVEAVRGVSLAVAPGRTFGLIGHNGAGKSTLFRMMLGLIVPDAGTLRLLGEPSDGARFREVRQQIGYLPEHVALYDNLSGLETLRFYAKLRGAARAECDAALERVGLAHAATRKVRGYSKGMRQRLGFAQALLGKPKLLFLDEPTNGLDPQAIHDFYRVIAELKAEGATVVLTSHILAEIEQRVDEVAILREGRIVAQGSVAELRERAELPVRLIVRVTAEARERLIATLGASAEDAAHVALSVNRGDKLARIAQLAAEPGVSDLRLVEPSLEAVFLEHSQEAA
ncbi:ABC transporter ATP-binding protein [Niveibacterium microcysteis]|uniref:ABC transporter ATP-binding protein n=1 Tax=Niveibacterium microcysteis TaxID=2811415 RepID=A0ABX7M6T3_9RHOO|nr:ABC transporter ATP-binding protein [Niveibacterium microcysteis]QSI77457.1 ABC transporter ATP-binding protein [Niveibacterium microcysteis]